MKFNKKKVLIITESVIALIIMACALYLSDFYRADTEAIAAFHPDDTVARIEKNKIVIYEASNPDAGLIFYPGGKVEYTAYEPLMEALAEKGITSIVLEMPFHLAVFNPNAADGIQHLFPEIDHWMIGGHSLGGVIASTYASQHVSEFDGLILLASYSTADLSQTPLAVLSVYGSEDHVLNLESYKENKQNLPDDAIEIILEGGNHAQFGMYGVQSGDGAASITNLEQIEQTASAIVHLLQK